MTPRYRVVGVVAGWMTLAAVCVTAQQQPVDSPPTSSSASPPKQALTGAISTLAGWFQAPLHPTLATVAPGGGLTGGIGFTPPPMAAGNWRQSLRASLSTKRYWLLEGDTAYQDANRFRLEAYGRARRMTELPFFGVGPDSIEADLTDYLLLERTIGGFAWVRFVPSIAIGGRLEQLWPHVDPGHDSTVLSIEQVHSEQTAPGLSMQPSFTRYQAFVDFNHPAGLNIQARRGGDYKVGFNVYQDHASGQYSFRRVDIEGRERFPFGLDDKLTLHGLLSVSDAASGATVPFYLQSTLGGVSNLQGFRESLIGGDETFATLRGFRDFRFRDQDLLLLQAEFRHKVWGPVDLTVFVDAGKVAHQTSDLGFSHLRRDVGISISLMRVTATVVRLDFAFAGGEGTHTFLTPGRVISP